MTEPSQIETVVTATELAPLANAYTIDYGPPQTIVVPNASRIATLQNVTVSGRLLQKQLVHLDPATNERTAKLGGRNGGYTKQEKDGDLHFCLGTEQFQPHIACELQNAADWLTTFNDAIGEEISVSGFFRCLFEHPGFHRNDDAHIFEIHPVHAVNLSGFIQPFDVGIPDQEAIHTWTDPNDLNEQDNKIQVVYDDRNDSLTFTDMVGKDENYVSVSGSISNVQLNENSSAPAQFTLTSPDITKPIQVYCLSGTSAASQLSQLTAAGTTNITLIGLRNIDLSQALHNQYVINLLGIDIQASS